MTHHPFLETVRKKAGSVVLPSDSPHTRAVRVVAALLPTAHASIFQRKEAHEMAIQGKGVWPMALWKVSFMTFEGV